MFSLWAVIWPRTAFMTKSCNELLIGFAFGLNFTTVVEEVRRLNWLTLLLTFVFSNFNCYVTFEKTRIGWPLSMSFFITPFSFRGRLISSKAFLVFFFRLLSCGQILVVLCFKGCYRVQGVGKKSILVGGMTLRC